MDWTSAKKYCEKLKKHLVTINNAKDQLALEAYLKGVGCKYLKSTAV